MGANVAMVAAVHQLEARMLESGKTVDLEVRHHLAYGTYTRELHIPAGVVLTGKTHKHSCINILAKGTIMVADGDTSRELTAPAVFVSEPGTKKAGFALTDTVWVNTHPWDGELDLKAIEAAFITPDIKLISKESAPCLG